MVAGWDWKTSFLLLHFQTYEIVTSYSINLNNRNHRYISHDKTKSIDSLPSYKLKTFQVLDIWSELARIASFH